MALELSRVSDVDWPELDNYPDRTLFQTKPWLDFIAESQSAEPIIARVTESGRVCGYFTGALIRKFGLKILGSPFPGWTTSYMGFNLESGIVRRDLLPALRRFAFHELGCVHLECMDRRMSIADADQLGWPYRTFSNFEIDLTPDEDRIFAQMKGSCRTSIRKAERSNVSVDVASDLSFAGEYYGQLVDVFAKQSLSPTYAIERVRLLIKHLLPTGNLLLVRARESEGRCIATGIYPAMNGSMYLWGGASWRQYQHLQPNEAVHWFSMKYWKSHGMTVCDMGGGGEYKRKFGGRDIQIPFVRKSRFPLLESARNFAMRLQTPRSS